MLFGEPSETVAAAQPEPRAMVVAFVGLLVMTVGVAIMGYGIAFMAYWLLLLGAVVLIFGGISLNLQYGLPKEKH